MRRAPRRLSPSIAFVAFIATAVPLLHAAPAAAKSKIELEYDKPSPASSLEGEIAVTVENNRPARKGGDELELIGQVRSTVGIPYGLFTGKRRSPHVDEVVVNWVAQTLRAAGWNATPAEGEPSGARVHMIIDEFWSDWEAGPFTYYTVITARLQVFPSGSSKPALEGEITAKDKVTLMFGMHEFAEAHTRMFAAAGEDIANMSKKPEFRAVVAP